MQHDNAKKMVILYGSPHNNSYTHCLLNTFTAMLNEYIAYHAPNTKIDIKLYDAYKLNIAPCDDCKYCYTAHKCKHNDFSQIERDIVLADIIVICSPVYFMSFPSPLKAIIDRTQGLWVSQHINKESELSNKKRKGLLLLTCGRDTLKGIDVVQRQANAYFITVNANRVGTAVFAGTDHITDNKIPEQVKSDLEKCIVNLFD